MGVSTYYLGLPRGTLDAIRAEEGCFATLQLLWHEGAGAWTAPAEFDRAQLVEFVGDLPLDSGAGAVVDTYSRLIREANANHPAIVQQRAYVENTHAYLEAVLTHHLRGQRIEDAAPLAVSAVSGGGGGEAVGSLWCLSEQTVRRIGDAVRGADATALLAVLPSFSQELAADLDWMSAEERLEHLRTFSTDEDLVGEFEELITLYSGAATTGHVVLLG